MRGCEASRDHETWVVPDRAPRGLPRGYQPVAVDLYVSMSRGPEMSRVNVAVTLAEGEAEFAVFDLSDPNQRAKLLRLFDSRALLAAHSVYVKIEMRAES